MNSDTTHAAVHNKLLAAVDLTVDGITSRLKSESQSGEPVDLAQYSTAMLALSRAQKIQTTILKQQHDGFVVADDDIDDELLSDEEYHAHMQLRGFTYSENHGMECACENCIKARRIAYPDRTDLIPPHGCFDRNPATRGTSESEPDAAHVSHSYPKHDPYDDPSAIQYGEPFIPYDPYESNDRDHSDATTGLDPGEAKNDAPATDDVPDSEHVPVSGPAPAPPAQTGTPEHLRPGDGHDEAIDLSAQAMHDITGNT